MYWQISRSFDMTSALALLRNSILARWPAFVLGCFLAFTTTRYGVRLKSWADRSREAVWLSLALFVAAIYVLSLLTHRRVATFDRLYAHVVWFDHNLYEALAWTVVLGVLLFLRLPGRSAVVNPVMDRIGVWSYSIYLVHLPVIKLVFEENVKRHPGMFARPLPWSGLLAASLALTLLLSVCTYYGIERPFLRLKSRAPRVRRPLCDAA
jgi:peptidoglycan/LPS O-acetylase OafA/YrhL